MIDRDVKRTQNVHFIYIRRLFNKSLVKLTRRPNKHCDTADCIAVPALLYSVRASSVQMVIDGRSLVKRANVFLSAMSRKSARGRPYFAYGREWSNIYWCTVEPCHILTLKNASVKCVYCVTQSIS